MRKSFISAICLMILILSFVSCTTAPAVSTVTPTDSSQPSIVKQFVGSSMEPNFHDEQIIYIQEVPVSELKRGDVVYFLQGEKQYLKRLIALPGETIELRNGKVFIDDQVLEEAYHPTKVGWDFRPITLKEDEYFVLGDNRNNSSDSRAFGPVLGANILGRVVP